MMNISRRDMVKSLLGIPVLGGFVYEFMRKWQMDSHKKTELFSELGLNTEKKIVKISRPKKESKSSIMMTPSLHSWTQTLLFSLASALRTRKITSPSTRQASRWLYTPTSNKESSFTSLMVSSMGMRRGPRAG